MESSTSRSPSVSPKRPANLDLRRLVGSVNQLRFNDNRGEVSFFGQKMIILRRDVIRVIREGLERLVGDQATPFLSYLASGIGIHEGSIFRESNTGPADNAAMSNMVTSALEDTNLGLGKIHVAKSDFEKGTANITISSCFEALENGKSEIPNCTFTSGFLAGMFAEVFDKTVQAIETRCMSQGQSECEFQINPVEEQQDANPKPPEAEAIENPQLEKPPTTSPAPLKHDGEDDRRLNASDSKKQTADDRHPGTGNYEPGKTDSKNGMSQVEIESGLERASRIAKRKDRFWNKWFQKND